VRATKAALRTCLARSMFVGMDSQSAMSARAGPERENKIIVIGCSRGGLSALTEVLQGLPVDLPAAIVVVQHLSPTHESRLADILNERVRLPVHTAAQGKRLEPGHVYVAPENQHITINEHGRIRLDGSARVNFSRPAVDRLFDSVATSFGERAIAVILTGWGKDGAVGAAAITRCGGVVIVQDEESSQDFGMARATIAGGGKTTVLPLPEIAGHLITLAATA
jgi:two-component system, chemotaxis family, protein-glutamate methylesterase/glutaminase